MLLHTCQKVSKKAMQFLGMVKRSFKYMDRESFITLYRAYTRPHLEICEQAWSPYLTTNIDSLEKVQRRAIKLVLTIEKLAYDEILRHLRLYSLCGRRQRGDLIETYKILNGWDHVEAGKLLPRKQSVWTYQIYSNTKLGYRLGTVSFRSGLVTSGMAFFKQWLMTRHFHNLKRDETDTGVAWDIGTNKGRRHKITH